ncbi:MAG: hypothetical protein ABSD28_13530 [Tepidisphaeraceae bacterium]|jgi:hypothetical protein
MIQLMMNLSATPISQVEHWLPDRWKRRKSAPSGRFIAHGNGRLGSPIMVSGV